MDLTTLGFAMGSAWLSGINLYATVLTLGLLQKFNLAHLPGDLGYLSNDWVIGLAATLYVVQFIADKIPAVDSVWDAIHTFIRVPAGAILAATAFGHFDPQIRLLALLVGGGIALSSHSVKATTRLAVNTSPEPFSNIAVSLLEDATTVGGTLLMAVHPAVLIGIVLVAIAGMAFLVRRISRSLRRRFGRKASAIPI
jgi:hypothetical protein